jgi:predicted NBD/HSP70 family sugar kinase
MRIRDEPFIAPLPIGRRVLAIVVTTLAMPFIVVGGAVWWLLLTVVQRILGWMMAFTVATLVATAVFAYQHDWNSAGHCLGIFLVFGAITGGVCCILHRPASEVMLRLR